MSWDPFGIQQYHDEVTDRIARDEPGLAQSVIGSDLASYEVREVAGIPTGQITTAGSARGREAMEELIIDVARGDGHATASVFSRDRVDFMIKDRRAFGSSWTKKKNELAALVSMAENRPELFY